VAFDEDLLAAAPRADKKLYRLIREQGFCASTGDRLAQVAGISAPVFRQDKSLAGALTLTMPEHRYDARHVKQVIAAARELSSEIP
jgi:DNA-binding IclR family transcriptional regulator